MPPSNPTILKKLFPKNFSLWNKTTQQKKSKWRKKSKRWEEERKGKVKPETAVWLLHPKTILKFEADILHLEQKWQGGWPTLHVHINSVLALYSKIVVTWKRLDGLQKVFCSKIPRSKWVSVFSIGLAKYYSQLW